jgi:hypothetical protein
LLNRLFDDQLAMFQDSPESAKEFLAIGDHKADKRADPAELAALTIVAEAMMNHYDTVTKQ